jgi:hypothetical protein
LFEFPFGQFDLGQQNQPAIHADNVVFTEGKVTLDAIHSQFARAGGCLPREGV